MSFNLKYYNIIAISLVFIILLSGCVSKKTDIDDDEVDEMVYEDDSVYYDPCEEGIHSTNLGVCTDCNEYINNYGEVLTDLSDCLTPIQEPISSALECHELVGSLNDDVYSIYIQALDIAEGYHKLAIDLCEEKEELADVLDLLKNMDIELSQAKNFLYTAYKEYSNYYFERFTEHMVNYLRYHREACKIVGEMLKEKIYYTLETE